MKNIRDLVIAVAAGAALFATGCSPKPATTSEAAPASSAEQPEAAQKPEPMGGGAAQPAQRRPASGRERASGSALTPSGNREAAPARVTAISLPEGTSLKVRTTTALSTKTAKTGDTFTASLMNDIVQDGVTVAPKGATVRGQVVESDPGGRVKGRAAISVRLTEMEVDGKMVPLSTDTVGQQASGTKKKDALKVGIGSGLGAAIGAIAGGGKGAAIGAAAGAGAGGGAVLATRGDAAVIPAEAPLTFRLTAPARVR